MATEERMAMPTDSDILTLTQWFSPAYPVGAFAYSHGLEWAIEAGDVTDADSAELWISDVVQHGAGWNDCLFLIAAFQSKTHEKLIDTDASAKAFSASSERLKETVLQGDAFCAITSAVWSHDLQGLSYPVAIGQAAYLQGLPLQLTTRMYLQSFMANLVAAATRLVPLGQTSAQQLIRDLTPHCTKVATTAQTAGLDTLGATAFLSDIASMKHETQYSRIFRT